MFTRSLLISFLSVSLLVVSLDAAITRETKVPATSSLLSLHAPGAPTEVKTPVIPTARRAGGMGYMDQTGQFTFDAGFKNRLANLIRVYVFKDNPTVGYIAFAGHRIASINIVRSDILAKKGQILIGHLPNMNVYIHEGALAEHHQPMWKNLWKRMKGAARQATTRVPLVRK